MRIVFLYQGPHKCHEKWAKVSNADFCHFRRDKIGKADIIIVEGGAPLIRAANYKAINPKTKIIYLNADETILVWRKRVIQGRAIGHFFFWFHALARVDGVISVSRLVQLNIGIPELIVHPFIQKEYEQPIYNASSENILTVGYYHEKQGIDLLVNAFRTLKKDERFEDTKLFLVGHGYPKEYSSKDVILTGFVEEISSIYKRCGVYVHAGRFQAFPVAVIEAMHYGLPVIVTDRTGVCEILDKRFVSTTKPKDIASKTKYLILLPSEEKMLISTENYKKSLEFLEEKKVEEFTKAFYILTNKAIRPRSMRNMIRLLPSFLFLLLVLSIWIWPKLLRRVYNSHFRPRIALRTSVDI